MVPSSEGPPAGGEAVAPTEVGRANHATRASVGLARSGAALIDLVRAHKGAPLCLVAVTVVVWILARRLVLAPIGFDESYFLWTGWSLNHGLVPYRDFIEYKPVMIFVLNALGLKVFGLDYHHYRYIFAILSASAFLGLAVTLMRRGADSLLTFCVVVAMASALFASSLHDLTINDTETAGMSFLLLGIVCLIWGGVHANRANALGGAFLTLAVMSKEPFAFIALTTWAALGFLNRTERGLPWRRFAAWSCAGAAVVVVVILCFLLVTGALPYYVTAMRDYFGYTARIGCPKPTGLLDLVALAWRQLTRMLLTPGVLGGLLPFLIAFAVGSEARWGARIGVVLAVLAGLHAVTLGGCYFRHYFIMGLSGFFLWGTLGAVALGRSLSRAPTWLAVATRVVVLAWLVVEVGPRFRTDLETTYSVARVDLMGTPRPVVDFINQNTAPTDYVFSDGMPGIFLLTNRLRPTRESGFLDEFIDSYPGRNDAEKLSAVRAQLVARKPKVIYLDRGYAGRKRRTRAALIMPFIKQFGYQQVMENVYFRKG